MPSSRSSSVQFRVEQARRAAGLVAYQDYRLTEVSAGAAPPKAAAASSAPPVFNAFSNYGVQWPQCQTSPTSKAEGDAAAAKSAALHAPRAVEKGGGPPLKARTPTTPAAPPPKGASQQQGEAQAPDQSRGGVKAPPPNTAAVLASRPPCPPTPASFNAGTGPGGLYPQQDASQRTPKELRAWQVANAGGSGVPGAMSNILLGSQYHKPWVLDTARLLRKRSSLPSACRWRLAYRLTPKWVGRVSTPTLRVVYT